MALQPPIPGNHPDRDCTPISATASRTTGATGVGGDLKSYVDRLEAQLNNGISGLDTTQDSDNDHNSQKYDSVDYDAADTDNEETAPPPTTHRMVSLTVAPLTLTTTMKELSLT